MKPLRLRHAGLVGGGFGSGPFLVSSDGLTLYSNISVFPFGGVAQSDLAGNFSAVYTVPTPTQPKKPRRLLEKPDGTVAGLAESFVRPVLFEFGPDGDAEPIHLFSQDDVIFAAMLGGDGRYYFGTAALSPPDYGRIFRLEDNGAETTLHAFTDADGWNPSGLLEVSGEIWGTNNRGGSADGGTVFRIDALGTFDKLHDQRPGLRSGSHGDDRRHRGGGRQRGLLQLHHGDDTRALAAGTVNDVIVTNPDGVSGTLPKGWVSDFLDVPGSHQFYAFVTTLVSNAITVGVGGGLYGIDQSTLRQQMAVFLLRGKSGLCYAPPPCIGLFPDVPCPSLFAAWIEALFNLGITGGCGGGNYCPQNPVLRQQMAVFLLKALEGSNYVPPGCTGMFADVPCPSPFADWVEDLAGRGITGGCGGGNYCPGNFATRGQTATFVSRTFDLQ